MLEAARAQTPSPSLRERVEALSGGLNGSRLLRLHCPLDLEDPWVLLPSPELEGRRIAGWAAADRCFLAVDMVRRHRLSGEDRFRRAGQIWSRLAGERAELSLTPGGAIDARLPCVLAGFAFSTRTEATPQWEDWGDGALWVPEILIHRQPDQGPAAAVLTVELDPDHLDAGYARLMGLLGRLERLLSSVRGQRAASPVPAGRNSMTRTGRGEAAWCNWRDRVESVKDDIRSGRMEKVVLARAEKLHALAGEQFDPLATAVALRDRQADCTTFVIRRAGGQAFVGATPEALVRLRDRQVDTVALAGTRSRGWDDDNDAELGRSMLDSPKDRREQDLVARAIRAALDPIVDDLEIPDTPDVARFADVQHLRTRIRATTREGVGLFELVERLHPTPAVGGLPHDLALDWLDRNEGLDRGWYAGPIGWVDARGDGVFMVAIRSALIQGGQALAYAGCGLVARSDAREEWEETVFKLQPINRGLVLESGAGARGAL